jgi:hypothetical protein
VCSLHADPSPVSWTCYGRSASCCYKVLRVQTCSFSMHSLDWQCRVLPRSSTCVFVLQSRNCHVPLWQCLHLGCGFLCMPQHKQQAAVCPTCSVLRIPVGMPAVMIYTFLLPLKDSQVCSQGPVSGFFGPRVGACAQSLWCGGSICIL